MAKRYQVWNKTDNIITPIGEVLSPAQWIERYPVANALDIVIGGGTINGSFFAVYDAFVDIYEKMGCDFSGCTTQQDYLDAIEAFEDEQNQPVEPALDNETRIADALEDLVVLNMPDVDEEV